MRITWNLNSEYRIVRRKKAPKNFRNRSRESPLRGDSLPKSGNFWYFWDAFPPPALIKVKFSTAKQTPVPVGPAKCDLNRCNESPLRGEKPDFWPVSKFNAGSLPLCGNPPSKNLEENCAEFLKLKRKLHTWVDRVKWSQLNSCWVNFHQWEDA